ncbi:MAG: type III-B CRISPR-associated protein Cas10/Cmr2 [Deltaproteobacteria bacterium]|nr:type III-B CRISPR-associated protein Cas10/Cmr2 [Deltaproteobacteria bacterium]
MNDALLIFTFSPIQSFITEARRASDLYVGSRILVRLAQAAAQAIEKHEGMLIYPAPPLTDDVPNKFVARVPWQEATTIAEEAKRALLNEWSRIADTANWRLTTGWEIPTRGPLPDAAWHAIWARQVSHQWEIYWAVASMDSRSYRDAYDEASRAVDAAKRARTFAAVEEHGVKDTLSGCREALHTGKANAREYWAEISEQVGAAKLRPDGRERLDAIGAVKRFSDLAEKHFPSTSTVASADFLEGARGQLADYRDSVENLLGSSRYRVQEDSDWPYDGDLLFIETLTPQRLESSYGLTVPDPGWLQMAQDTLREVYKQVKPRPAPYYAIIALDGDDMGKRVNECLTQTAHTELSRKLTDFADRVKPVVKEHQGSLIYNGGDDVLALAPLSSAFPLARALAVSFKEVTGGTASAGIAIVHHLYPLGAALQAARAAERQAKQVGRKNQVEGKNAVCVHSLKRSGEPLEIRSPWESVGEVFAEVMRLFQGDAQGEPLSSKFAYDVLHAAYALPDADEKCRAELKRLIKRHRNPNHLDAPNPDEWADRLRTWAASLPDKAEELGRWLVFARFVAQGGRD